METVNATTVEITIAGKNVTGDVSPFLSKFAYTDKEETESDDMAIAFEDTSGKWQADWYPSQGDTMQAKIITADGVLDCGLFEIDETELEFPPDVLSVKAIAAAVTQGLRTRNSKAFEKQTLRQIAQYFADKHKLKLVGKASDLQKIEVERKTQDRQTDLSFLASLAHDYGIVFSTRGNQLVFMDMDELEAKPSIMTIDRTQMSNARFRDKTSEVYAAAVVKQRNTRGNSVSSSKWTIKQSGNPAEKDELLINAGAENDKQAQARAKGALRSQNKDKIMGSFSIPGNIKLVAGVNIDLTSIGKFSGKWHVTSSTHNVDPSGGYTTEVSIRKIVE